MLFRFFIILIFILTGIIINTSVSAVDSEIIYEQFYILKSKGVKTGFVHITQRKININDTLQGIATEKHIEQKFKRLNDDIELVQDQTFIEDQAGNPVEFIFESQSNDENINITGKFDSKTAQINVNSLINDIKESKSIAINEKILFPYAIDKLYRETTVNEFNYSTIEPGINLQVLKIKATKLGKETIKQGFLNGAYTKYKNEINIFPNTSVNVWKNPQGQTMKESASLFNMEQIAVSKNEILDIPADFDVFSASLIRVDKVISEPEMVDQALYKITGQDVSVNDFFLDDLTQSIIEKKDNSVFLKVKAENNLDYKAFYPINKSGFDEYLKTGPFIITDSEKIKKLTQKLVYGETDAYKISEKMRSWVYENITDKNYSVDFANSVQVLETLSGDCTEHSILLASLLRAAGIPAKVVIGLVYANQPENAFVYHMWVKAYVGKWINLDPSQPYERFTPLHLAMAESSMNDISAKSDIIFKVIESISRINIEILDISKPIVNEISGKPEIKVNLNNNSFIDENNLVNLRITEEVYPAKTDINLIKFVDAEKKDNIKQAFFSFTRGDTENALAELKEFHKTLEPDDDFQKMKLALKLINLSYFNFASEIFREIQDKEIWGALIKDLYNIYFPKIFFYGEKEKILVTAFYSLNYNNDPDFVLELTKDIKGSDYIFYLRAEAFLANRDSAGAEESIKQALKINPYNLTYNFTKIKALIGQDRIYESQETLNSINMTIVRENIKDKEIAKKIKSYDYWLKSKQFNEDIALRGYYQANYYMVNGDINAALDILAKIANKHQQPYLLELLADAYYEINQFDAAKKYYEKALIFDENLVKSNLGLGNINFFIGQYPQAQKHYEKILKTRKNNIDALIAMAKLKSYLKEDAKALDYYKKVLKSDKNNPDVLYNLGIILANRKNYTEAEKMLKKVLSADPLGNSSAWLDLAKIKISGGDYLNAAKYLRNAKYLNENDPYYYYFMGIILDKKGASEEAKKYFKKAVDLKPDLIEEL